jgi:hypothetical protein
MSTDPQVARFKWADEPPPTHAQRKPRRATVYDVIAKRLKANTGNHGRWALVATDVHYTIITKLKKSHPEILWTTRKKVNSNKSDLWASYPKQPTKDQQVETAGQSIQSN